MVLDEGTVSESESEAFELQRKDCYSPNDLNCGLSCYTESLLIISE